MSTSRARSRALAAAAVATLAAGLVAVPAHADSLAADGDTLTPGTDVALGEIPCGQAVPFDAALTLVRSGVPGTTPVFADGATVAFDTGTASGMPQGTWLGYPNEWPVIQLPGDWTSQPDGTVSPAATYAMSLESTVEGPGEVTLRWYAGGPSANPAEEGAYVTADHRITWTTVGCRANTPPTTPGQIQASTTVTRTGVSLSWAPSIDPDGDPLTYTLETRDQDDAAWSTVITGLTGTAVALAQPPEGRRIYRVTAVEQGTHEPLEQSQPGAPSATIVVDRGVPNSPTATTSRAPEHVAADGTRWWRDNLGITFASAGDAKLPDGSAGSGVVSVTGTTTVAAAGAFTRTGTAVDAAGNQSSSTVTGALDAVHPSVNLACPAQVTLGSAASASWTASDEAGGSGLATAASGQLVLDTSAVGTRTATLASGHARDRVGHLSEATGCSYRVVYPFAGFFRSVDTDRVNVAKAGRAVALSFSLGGNRGLGILDGAPAFTVTGGPLAGEEIVQAGKLPGPGLTYDSATGQYTYLWQTDRAWLNKTGTVSVRLNDGTVHTAVFSFR